MTSLPASIEAYLLEAGFSPTEILILKRLLEGDALTLRELGSKTGKSTGVLDQATKKLLGKKILSREVINATPKFTVSSLHAIAEWVESDMQSKRALMQRKHKDFETFLSTLELDKGRPEMEYYEDREGIEQAFTKLLDRGDTWLCYSPATIKEEEDPLREFRVQLFRQRRTRKIFARVISPDTPLGKRFASRDVFEYRETKLIPEDQLPVGFEKIIVGDTIACFNHAENKACFIRYGEMADSQRKLFEMLWCMGSGKSEEECVISGVPAVPAVASLETKTLSGLREFFLSRKSLITMGLLVLLSAGITFGLYWQNQKINFNTFAERSLAIAATASLQIDAAIIENIRSQEDMFSVEYQRIYRQLNEIRNLNPEIAYIYIIRPNKDLTKFEWMVDADSNPSSFTIADINRDGIIDDADASIVSGEQYDVSSFVELQGEDYSQPIKGIKIQSDKWGSFVTSYAPIKDLEGKVIGLLGVDFWANDIKEATFKSFSPFALFALLFLIFCGIRLSAFNKPLYKEITSILKQQSVLFTLCLALGLAGIATQALYVRTSSMNLERIRERTTAIAATSALLFTGEEIDRIQDTADVGTPNYESVVRRLMKIQQENENVAFTYILRPSGEPGMYSFVAANDGLDPSHPFDSNDDGVINEADAIAIPGDMYDVTDMDALQHGPVIGAIANRSVYEDQWGTFLTAYSPIHRKDGSIAALFSVDVRVEMLQELNRSTFKPFTFFVAFFFLFIFVRLVVFNKSLAADILKVSRSKKVLVTLAGCGLIALGITYGMYWYTLNLMKEEVGNRLMAIAATAATQIDAKDLEPLRFARDMKRPEYQRVFEKLNEIRSQNQNVQFVYIMRPSGIGDMYQFVADADSNYYLPLKGIIDPIEVVAPGTFYDDYFFGDKYRNYVMKQSVSESEFISDKWGTYISGAAPILNQNNEAVAFIGLDMDVSDFYLKLNMKFQFLFWCIATFILIISIRIFYSICLLGAKKYFEYK